MRKPTFDGAVGRFVVDFNDDPAPVLDVVPSFFYLHQVASLPQVVRWWHKKTVLPRWLHPEGHTWRRAYRSVPAHRTQHASVGFGGGACTALPWWHVPSPVLHRPVVARRKPLTLSPCIPKLCPWVIPLSRFRVTRLRNTCKDGQT